VTVEGPPLDDTESDLIERARQGDAAAFEEIVCRYQEIAFRVAFVIDGSAEEAEEAALEGFLRAHRSLGRFRAGAPLRPWLLTIVANAARTRRAAAARHPTLPLNIVADRVADDADDLPEAAVLAAEKRHELLIAVHALRADDQQVIASRYFLGLSEAETAEVLGCARGTVKSRLSRALQRLRVNLTSPASAGEDHDG
jgi:RNA polymerase sigma factor (sigma-70 family)